MRSLMRKAVKLLKAHGFVEGRHVKHGTQYNHPSGVVCLISGSPRTEAFYNDVKQNIARATGIKKSLI